MRAAILINGISARGGGGKEVFDSFLDELFADRDRKHKFVVVAGGSGPSRDDRSHGVVVVDVPWILRRRGFLPLFYLVYLPLLVRAHKVSVILNFADLIIPTKTRQIYFFDWSYLVHPESAAWTRMSPGEYLARRAKLHAIRRFIRYPTLTLAQTELMAERLRSLYGLLSVQVIPSAVSSRMLAATEDHDFGLPPDRTKLLCLANDAPHKNIAIIAPLAQRIGGRNLPITIVTTLGAGNDERLRRLLRDTGAAGSSDAVVNVGTVKPAHVSALYRQCDALFLPTLLESFGLPFYEAMALGRTVITSDLDFARDACGEAAFYFDPFSADSALEAIVEAFSDERRRLDRIRLGKERVQAMPRWPQVYRAMKQCIDQVADGEAC